MNTDINNNKKDVRWLQRFLNFRKALAINIIDDAKWMYSIEDRNQTSHNYDNDVVNSIFTNIIQIYFSLFCQFEEKMIEISKNI